MSQIIIVFAIQIILGAHFVFLLKYVIMIIYSTDNLVEGKRRAGNTTTHDDVSVPKKPLTSQGASCVEGEEAPQSSTRGKRRIHPLPQQATSTPTRKEKGRGASRLAGKMPWCKLLKS